MTADNLRAFEREVADAFEAKRIRAPIHLSDGNEEQLIEIFREIAPYDWVFSTWRSHYHALLHGVPREMVMSEIMAGRSMMLHFPGWRFFTSAIVGGILPIACGVAAASKEADRVAKHGDPLRPWVWCFVGDMTASIGAFHDAANFAAGHGLPITFVVEDNGLATNTPTEEAWGIGKRRNIRRYRYDRGAYPHVGSGPYVAF